MAAARGLRLPLVYNTCGWERPEILRRLDGIVDIYLPDFKYSDGAMASKYSAADTYPEVTKDALLEMHRQVGVAKPAADGLMYRGLMIRHLVMPNGVSGSRGVIDWIAEHLPKDTYVNIMSQYTPLYRANEFPEIDRRLTGARGGEQHHRHDCDHPPRHPLQGTKQPLGRRRRGQKVGRWVPFGHAQHGTRSCRSIRRAPEECILRRCFVGS